MAYRIEIKPRAERDLEAIFTFIQAEQSQTAQEWFTGLRAAIRSLANFPERGTIVQGTKMYRRLLYGSSSHPYRIIYRIEQNLVTISHIRHGARKGPGMN